MMIYRPWTMTIPSGQLTNHKKFGEDLAILAGDALFSLDPFGMIAASDLSDAVKVSFDP